MFALFLFFSLIFTRECSPHFDFMALRHVTLCADVRPGLGRDTYAEGERATEREPQALQREPGAALSAGAG